MDKAGQTVGQTWDSGNGLSHRAADERVVLVSARHAVWDRRAIVPVPPVEEDAGAALTAMGPLPTEWTADLVHCRLLHVFGAMAQLARVLLPAKVRSILGQLQPQEPGVARRPLTGELTTRIDWTLSRIYCWGEDDQAIILGFACGQSLREIAAELRRLQATGIGVGKGISAPSVAKRYRTIGTVMAREWNLARQPIDEGTREAWMTVALKKQ